MLKMVGLLDKDGARDRLCVLQRRNRKDGTTQGFGVRMISSEGPDASHSNVGFAIFSIWFKACDLSLLSPCFPFGI